MYNLIFDTATERGFVGLAQEGELLESIELPVGLHNSKFLFPALMEILQKRGIKVSDLGCISAGVGPGSYTGIRVAAAAAQAMAYALKIPLIGFSSLEGFVPMHAGLFAAAIDAKYGGVYLLKGSYEEHLPVFEGEPVVLPVDKALEYLREIPLIVSPQIESLKEKLSLPNSEWQERFPSARVIAIRAFESYQKGKFSANAELKLLYLRKTQAEENLS